MFPLVKKLFGSSALGGSTPAGGAKGGSDETSPIVTIGSYPKKKRTKSSQFDDTIDEGNKYIILEERSFHHSTAELKPGDESALEQTKGVKHPGW